MTTDYYVRFIFMYQNQWMFIQLSQQFLSMVLRNNRIMEEWQTGNKHYLNQWYERIAFWVKHLNNNFQYLTRVNKDSRFILSLSVDVGRTRYALQYT